MIKRISLLYRKEGMSLDDFRRHWREVQAPIASRMPRLKHYLQQDVVSELGLLGSGMSAEDLPDGIAELTYEDETTSKRSLASPEGLAAVADLKNFRRTLSTFVVEVREVL
ncbi:MAG: EthD family reductase [Betaproteobacteria bacterium]|nr:EthD family reductase [Betaproteobacteria bacterium]